MAIAIAADNAAAYAAPDVEVYESHYLGAPEKAVGWVLMLLALAFWSFVASSTVAGILAS
jgi:hypothetical protein